MATFMPALAVNCTKDINAPICLIKQIVRYFQCFYEKVVKK